MNRYFGNDEPSMDDAAFSRDVFLSHRAKDKAVVRLLAERCCISVMHTSDFGARITGFGLPVPLRLNDACPKGAAAPSPRLAPRAYLGFVKRFRHNPNGVAANMPRQWPQPRWGCGFLARGFPRVARTSQPWALRRSPVGAESRARPNAT